MTLADSILALLAKRPGLTDREMAEALSGPGSPQQAVNQRCRQLAAQGKLVRRNRPDGRIGNFLADAQAPHNQGPAPRPPAAASAFGEDALKRALEFWLKAQGWTSHIAWGKTRGVDIDAKRGTERWLIEVKGEGSRPEMRVNYFVAMLGELLQRMDDPAAKYSIALPDLGQFRRLWSRLPTVAKSRTSITALFITQAGHVEELK